MAEKRPLYTGLGTYRLDGSPRLPGAYAKDRPSTALEDAGVALIEKLESEGMSRGQAREIARSQGLTMLGNQPLLRTADLTGVGGAALAAGDLEQDPGLLTGVGAAAGILGLGIPARLAKAGLKKTGSLFRRGLEALMPASDFTKALEEATTTTMKKPKLSPKAMEAVKKAREARGATSKGRAEFADEAYLSHSHGEGENLADFVGGPQTGKDTRYKSKLRNALFNENSLLLGGGDTIKPNKPINSNRVRSTLSRMGVSKNEMQVSGITDLLNNNKTVTLKQLQDTSDKYTPRLSVVRFTEESRNMPNRMHQRWTHDPFDYTKATDEFNVVDYEEVLINDNRPTMSDIGVGSDHFSGVRGPTELQSMMDQQGHFRGSVLTEFGDEKMQELFPDGAFLSEEIQTDFNFDIRNSIGAQKSASENLTRQLSLGRERVVALSDSFDNDNFMNELAEFLPVGFEKGATDFADSSRRALSKSNDGVIVEAQDVSPSMINILEAAIDYKNVRSGEADRLQLRQMLKDAVFDSEEIADFFQQLDAAPTPSKDVLAFRDKLFDISDSQDEITLALEARKKAGSVIEMTPERQRILSEGDLGLKKEQEPFFRAEYAATSAVRDAQAKAAAIGDKLSNASEIEARLEGPATAIIEAAERAGVDVGELGDTAAKRFENKQTVDAYRRAVRQANSLSKEYKAAREATDKATKDMVVKARKDLEDVELDFMTRNPEYASLKGKKTESQFVFENESDFVRFTVDAMIERARARGLSGVIFPDWQDIRDIRMPPPVRSAYGDEMGYKDAVKKYESASNKFRAMYNDTIKKRLNEHKAANPGSKVVFDLPINSSNTALEKNRIASAEHFKTSDEVRKPFGYSFGETKTNERAEIPPASFAKGGMVYKGIGSMGREVL